MSYTTKHKMVLQSLMWSKCISKNELILLFKKLQIDENNIDAYISLINSKINHFNFNISRGFDDFEGDLYYALVCISENDITKLASIYSPEQLEVLKSALEIFVLEKGKLKADTLINKILNNNIKITIPDAYATLNDFVAEKYFYNSKNYLCLAPRGIIEFSSYFRLYYKDYIADCFLCSTTCLRYVECQACSTIMHVFCAKKLLNQDSNCLKCNQPLCLKEDFDLVEEKSYSLAEMDNSSNDQITFPEIIEN